MRHKLLNLDERVAQDLRIKIEEGDYQPGQILPGERENWHKYMAYRGIQ